MNKLKYIAVVSIAVAGLGLQKAQAHLSLNTQFTLSSPIGSPANDTAYLIDNFGEQADLLSLFKENNDGTTDGLYGSYFTVTMTSGNLWTVSWDLTGSGYTLEAVLLKDGVSSPHHQLYRLYDVVDNEG